MSRLLSLLFCALTLLAHVPEAQAQLGGIRARMERAAQQRAEREAREHAAQEREAQSTRSTASPEASGVAPRGAASLLGARTQGPDYTPLDYSTVPLPPAVPFTSVLHDIDLGKDDGLFNPTDFSAVFVPNQDIEGNPVNHLEQMRGRFVLLNADGEPIMERYYRGLADGNPTAKRFTLAPDRINRRDVAWTQRNRLLITASGDYTAEYYLDDRLLTRVPFRVVRIASSDPYATTPPRYVLSGPWQTMGFVDYDERESGDDLFQWNWYEQLEDPDETRYTYEATLELRKDGRLLGRTVGLTVSGSTSRQIHTHTIKHVQRSRSTSAYDEATVRQSDITDGDYELRLINTSSGQTRTARFTVRDGALVPAGNQLREGTAPEDFIEGLNRSFFYPFSAAE